MKSAFLPGLLVAATLTSVFSEVTPAAAFTWNNSWSQPLIESKSKTGFDDTPFQQFVQAERLAIPESGVPLLQLDSNKLRLKYDFDVSVFFVNEGAGYRNQLAYEATGTTTRSNLIFNDISSAESIGNWGGDALNLGDGVNLGHIQGGTQLDFWLRADGLNRGNNANIFGTHTASNADGLQHVVAYGYKDYLLLGFEDLYGALNASGGKNEYSDRDFNDTVFAVRVGERNVKSMAATQSVPEPSFTLAAAATAIASTFSLRRRC